MPLTLKGKLPNIISQCQSLYHIRGDKIDHRYTDTLVKEQPASLNINHDRGQPVQIPCTFEIERRHRICLPYLVYLPKTPPDLEKQSYGPPYPLIVFLHGAGERGENVNLLKRHGIPKHVETHPGFPFMTISPQCPCNTWWPNEIDTLEALLDWVLQKYPVDASRIYLTGLSMGGYGAWHWAASHAERFAAVAPICGGGHWAYGFPEKVLSLTKTPVWAFHGAKDAIVPVSESETLVQTLKSVGGNATLTIYPKTGHDCWTETYARDDLYLWMLSHRIEQQHIATQNESRSGF